MGAPRTPPLPEIGAAAGEEHLDDLSYLEAFHIQLGEDDRHTGAENPHQGDLPRKERYAVAGGQQIGKIQQKRPDQIGRDAEDAEIPAAQRAPEILAGHQHKRYAQQAKATSRTLRVRFGVCARRWARRDGCRSCPALLRADAVRPALLREVPLAEPERFLVPELFVDFCRNEIVPWYCFSLSCFLKKRYAYSL